MFLVSCSGFPIAVSRYLNEFRAVEIADSEIGIPGMGTLRRWQREAPEGFVFTMLAPAAIAGSGFAKSGENDRALKSVLSFAKKLGALAVVFRVPEDVPHSRATAERAKELLSGLRAGGPIAVLDAAHWKPSVVAKLCASAGAVAAQDPLAPGASAQGTLAYLVMPGPAGHRSRYDEDSLAAVAALCRRSTAQTTLCVFRNIDMEANAKTLADLVAAHAQGARTRA